MFLFAGQSNAQPKCRTGIMAPAASVAGFQKTAINRWLGDSPASPDSGVQYERPSDAYAPCLYNESANGNFAQYAAGFGSHAGRYPNTSGGYTEADTIGLDYSFLVRHLAAFPGTPIGAVKCAVGGTSLRSDWLPAEYQVATCAAATTTTLTLNALDINQYRGSAVVGYRLQMTSGAQAGVVQTVTAYDSGTRTVTVSPGWASAPSAGDGYGIDKLCFRQLRLMIADAAVALDAADGPGNWRWAGFVWMQGESGAHADFSDDSAYLADGRGLFAAVRGLTRAALPVVVGRLGNNWGWEAAANPDTLSTGQPNTYLAASGYPYAALVASYQSSQAQTVDGRVSPNATAQSYLNGARARRATQITLGTDPNCCWWSNDDLPVDAPFWPAWAAFWSVNVAGLPAGSSTYAEDWYGYHTAGAGQLAAGERAFAAYQRLTGRRVRVRTRAGKFLVRGAA